MLVFRTPGPFLAGRVLKHWAVTAFEDIEEIKFPYTSSMPKSLTSAGRHPWQAPPSLPWGEGGCVFGLHRSVMYWIVWLVGFKYYLV